MSKLYKILALGLVLPFIIQCGGGETSFSLLEDTDVFQAGSSGNDKLDILWVIDNSGSMATSQTNLANNMSSFINNFSSKNLDFRMTVIGTDSFRHLFDNSDTCAEFRDGPVRYNYTTDQCQNTGSHNGYPIITPGTPDMLNAFLNNVLQGTQGYGDERPLQSITTSLNHPNNQGFLRADSYMSVIMLTDEDDFSHNGSNNLQSGSINNPALHPIQDYVDYLDNYTNSSGVSRRYNVNSIAIFDQPCLDLLNSSWNGRKMGIRVGALSDATNGLKTSLCGDFAADLEDIAENIVALSNEFFLSRDPIPASIVVKVGGVEIPETTGPSGDGWVYDAGKNSILIYGAYQPSAGESIAVTFDPVQYGS